MSDAEARIELAGVRLWLRRTHPSAILPAKSHESDVGFDLFSIQQGRIFPGETAAVDTGWRLSSMGCDLVPPLFTAYAKIEQRSGLALKSVFPVGGIIDPGYRGQLLVLLHNSSYSDDYDVSIGDRIGQLVFYVVPASCKVFETGDEPTESDRGTAGLGSTGK